MRINAIPATTGQDYPLVRASSVCPCCSDPKSPGQLVCWPCYRELDVRNGNPEVTYRLGVVEQLKCEQLQQQQTGYNCFRDDVDCVVPPSSNCLECGAAVPHGDTVCCKCSNYGAW